MSWYRPTPSATKFSRYDWQQSLQTIQALHDAMTRAITPTLTDDEMLSLVGKSAITLRVSGHQNSFSLPWTEGVRIRFTLSAPLETAFDYILHPDADPRIVSILEEWVKHAVELEIEFGRMQALCRYFLHNYETSYTKKEVRYFFPGILSLVQTTGLEDIRVPRRNTIVPYHIRKAIERVSLTLASALMFKDMRFSTAENIKLRLHDREYNEEGFVFRNYDRYY